MGKALQDFRQLSHTKQMVLGGTTILLLILLVGLFVWFTQPERSVTNYCKVYAQERARLALLSASQNPYPSATFNVSVDDAGQIATSLGRLAEVAPADIEQNIKTLQSLYKEVRNDPTLDAAASLSGETIDNNLSSWTQDHCAQ